MTGVEHYDEAERLLAATAGQPEDHVTRVIARAHVHATLALAYATAAHVEISKPEAVSS